MTNALPEAAKRRLAAAQQCRLDAEQALAAACQARSNAETSLRHAEREYSDASMASCRVQGGVMPPNKMPNLSYARDVRETAKARFKDCKDRERKARRDVEAAQAEVETTRLAIMESLEGGRAREYVRLARAEAAQLEAEAAALRHEANAVEQQYVHRPATPEELREYRKQMWRDYWRRKESTDEDEPGNEGSPAPAERGAAGEDQAAVREGGGGAPRAKRSVRRGASAS